jgi:putative peptidoglycan lipid II flippase
MIKFLNGSIYSINAAALLIGAAGLLSRLLGVWRDRLLAGNFGASRELDIYYAAFQIPDFIFMIFLLGAASAAIIPVFTQIKERAPKEAHIFIGELVILFFLISGTIGAGIIFIMPYIIPFVAPGFGISDQEQVVTIARIIMVSPILLGLSSIISAIVQSARLFLAFSLAPIFYNLGIIFGILVLFPIMGFSGLGVGVVVGAALHLLVQLAGFRTIGNTLPLSPILDRLRAVSTRILGIPIPYRISDPVMRVIKLSFPRVLAVSLNQVTLLVLIAIASTLTAGSISVFQFAYNLHFLPVGIVGISFAVAAFPSLSEYATLRNKKMFFNTYYGTLRTIFFWIVPLTVFFYVMRAQIVRVALGTGLFDWEDTMLTAASLGLMSVAIVAESLIPLILRIYYALENTWKPLLINFASAVVRVASAIWFINVLQGRDASIVSFFADTIRVGALGDIAVLGLALSFSVGSFINLLFLISGIRKEVLRRFGGGAGIIRPWYDISVMVGVAFVAGFVSFVMLRVANTLVTLETFWGVLLQGGASFVVGTLFYGTVLYLFGNREVHQLVETIRRKLVRTEVLPEQIDDHIE